MKKYRSRISGVVHSTATDLYDAGVMDKKTMRELDALCLTPVKKLAPDEIKAIRQETAASQAVFARYLGVSPGMVSQWERGEKSPSGAALKLLALVQKNGLDSIAWALVSLLFRRDHEKRAKINAMTTLEIPAPEFVKRFQSGEIPANARVTVTYEDQDRVRAKLHQWQRETNTQTSVATSTRELFRQWDEEDAAMTEEEKRAESRLWEEVEQGINENRVAFGTRPR